MASQTPQDFKSLFNNESIARLGMWFALSDDTFDVQTFETLANNGLTSLEMKARAMHIRDALRAASALEPRACLESITHGLREEPAAHTAPTGFELWPVTMLVAQEGLECIEQAFEALLLLTRRFTAEFAIQPFLKHHPHSTLDVLRTWSTSDNEHDRRLVSEGTRTRLPWGRNMVAFFNAHQPDVLGLLDQLKDDPAVYVQKSVANHLNDLTKTHPELVLELLSTWALDPTPQRTWIIRHALRTLLKQGSPKALSLLGYTQDLEDIQCDVTQSAEVVSFGDALSWTARFAREESEQDDKALMVDYELQMASAKGVLRTKVFKWRTFTLSPSDEIEIKGSFAFKSLSTRRYYNGAHTFRLLINGVVQHTHNFELVGVV